VGLCVFVCVCVCVCVRVRAQYIKCLHAAVSVTLVKAAAEKISTQS